MAGHFAKKCNEVTGNEIIFTTAIYHCLHHTGSRNSSPTAIELVVQLLTRVEAPYLSSSIS